MPARSLKLIAAAAALLHLADAALVTLAHSHGPGPCHHVHAKLHHACGHAHVHGQTDEEPVSPDPLAPLEHEQDCAACRHLGQPLDHAPLIGEPGGDQLIYAVAVLPRTAGAPAVRRHYHARAPPRLAA